MIYKSMPLRIYLYISTRPLPSRDPLGRRGVAGEFGGADASLGGDAEPARGLHPDSEGEGGASLMLGPQRLIDAKEKGEDLTSIIYLYMLYMILYILYIV